ncbi:YcaO-like family protein [Streptomyces sp. ZYX-F-203]
MRTPESYGYVPRADLRDDPERLVGPARTHGREVPVPDRTRPDLARPVVKVVVPGLRHFWARFAPGWLSEAPVRLGRRSAPARHEDLNPTPLLP